MRQHEDAIKEIKTGTTTVGIVCKDGVVLAADQKATMGYLVASKDTQKVYPLDKHIGMTIAGLVGDALALERYIKAELKLYSLHEGRPISVKAAAYLIANILYSRRYYPYYVQLIVGGYDEKPKLYSFGPDGSVIEEKEYYSSGSGSPIAFGVLESDYRKNIGVEEGKKLAARSIRAAVQRDIASGGLGMDIVVIDSNGFRKLTKEEIESIAK